VQSICLSIQPCNKKEYQYLNVISHRNASSWGLQLYFLFPLSLSLCFIPQLHIKSLVINCTMSVSEIILCIDYNCFVLCWITVNILKASLMIRYSDSSVTHLSEAYPNLSMWAIIKKKYLRIVTAIDLLNFRKEVPCGLWEIRHSLECKNTAK